ncbi:hypothetical protein SAMN05444004_103189 [Jannaschia faecimaris]|uniref:Uncharacterized protein n=1 Tax=Jannaschia faecimaris TaxID=1244108 RepID=A0A1H3MW52_9RHOB|nr:hypothetical protein [Jannaschia faecimaris]SDY80694.1 hypothetical protein SAMN05444004_103189 [Jannaschia faecimaris]
MKNLRQWAARLLLVLFPLMGALAALSTLPAATASSPVLVIGLPGFGDPKDLVARAGGYPVGFFRPAFGQVAHSQNPDFLTNLRASGPFLLLNADKLPNFLCGRYA